MDNTRVIVRVRSWERNTLGKLHSAITNNFNLYAIGVELGAAARVLEVGDIAFVQSDHFRADKVAAAYQSM